MSIFIKTHVSLYFFFTDFINNVDGQQEFHRGYFTFLDSGHSFVLKCFIQGRISSLLFERKKGIFQQKQRANCKNEFQWNMSKQAHLRRLCYDLAFKG